MTETAKIFDAYSCTIIQWQGNKRRKIREIKLKKMKKMNKEEKSKMTGEEDDAEE